MKKTTYRISVERVRGDEGSHIFYYLELPRAFWRFSDTKQQRFALRVLEGVEDFLKSENVKSSLRHDPRLFICAGERRCIINGAQGKTRYPSPERCRQLWKNCKPLLRVLSWAYEPVHEEGNAGRGGGWFDVYTTAFGLGEQVDEGYSVLSKSPIKIACELFPEVGQVFERLGLPIWIPTESEFATSQFFSPQEVAKGYKEFLLKQAGLQAEIERKGGVATRVFYTNEQVLSHEFAYNMAVEAGWDGSGFVVLMPNEAGDNVEGVK